MKYLFPLLVLLTMTGCCRLPETVAWHGTEPDGAGALYKFRLERSGETRLAGLLALNFQDHGIWGGLLDATGVPLVKILVRPDGTRDIEFCAKSVCGTRLPEVLGNLVEYLYFTPASAACPWYAVSCICEKAGDQRTLKWKRLGPFHSWIVEQQNTSGKSEKIEARMYFSSVRVYLQRIENEEEIKHQDEIGNVHRTGTP